MTRLGSKLSFREAAAEVWYSHHLPISEATVRRVTYRHGAAAEEVVRQEVEALERDGPAVTAWPQQMTVSADGSFVPLKNGEWREVKSVAVGEFDLRWNTLTWQKEVKTRNISYFSRSYRAREFERYALGELHRRGLENAQAVVAVNDGAEWIQSFLDYHCLKSVRILDFAHAAGYLSQASKAIWEEGSAAQQEWLRTACRRLKHKPPRETIAHLRLLQAQAKTEAQAAPIQSALFYLETRLSMLDYPHFRRCGYPIGSGSVESGHKRVVQQRLKGAGMRWAEHHLDPMLALRDLVCNDRWDAGWQQIVLFHQEQQRTQAVHRAEAKLPPPPEPLTLATVKVANLLPEPDTATKTAPDLSVQSCVIRCMPITSSGACRSPIPVHADH
jgi:hypothetical protein